MLVTICLQEISISTPTPKMNVVEERLLRWGALFGETALTTNSPYFRTVVAAGNVEVPKCVFAVCVKCNAHTVAGVRYTVLLLHNCDFELMLGVTTVGS